MKTFRLHWRDGTVNDVQGNTIAEAMSLAGYGAGSLPALDYWELIKWPPSTPNEEQRP